jgi:hypothetical protein
MVERLYLLHQMKMSTVDEEHNSQLRGRGWAKCRANIPKQGQDRMLSLTCGTVDGAQH